MNNRLVCEPELEYSHLHLRPLLAFLLLTQIWVAAFASLFNPSSPFSFYSPFSLEFKIKATCFPYAQFAHPRHSSKRRVRMRREIFSYKSRTNLTIISSLPPNKYILLELLCIFSATSRESHSNV